MSSLVRTSAARRDLVALTLAALCIAALAPRTVRADDSTSVSPAVTATPSASAPARHATLPAASPDGKLVAYCSERDGVTDIFVVDVGMGISRRVTNTPEVEGPPAWADDGRSIVFTVARGDTTALISVPAAGGMATTIVELPGVRSIELSNDGKKLAVTRGSWARSRLGVASRNGSMFRALTDSASAWYNLAWSPNDAGIAAARNDSAGSMTLVLIRAESGRKNELVRMPNGYGRPQWPAWSENGKTILFQAAGSAEGEPTERDVYIHKLDVKSRKLSRLRRHDRPMLDEAPCWLDEKQIVFQSNQSGAFELWIMRADGTLAKQLTH
jgi:Tol biopolymer transport system component